MNTVSHLHRKPTRAWFVAQLLWHRVSPHILVLALLQGNCFFLGSVIRVGRVRGRKKRGHVWSPTVNIPPDKPSWHLCSLGSYGTSAARLATIFLFGTSIFLGHLYHQFLTLNKISLIIFSSLNFVWSSFQSWIQWSRLFLQKYFADRNKKNNYSIIYFYKTIFYIFSSAFFSPCKKSIPTYILLFFWQYVVSNSHFGVRLTHTEQFAYFSNMAFAVVYIMASFHCLLPFPMLNRIIYP
jgi:hypothetical protein